MIPKVRTKIREKSKRERKHGNGLVKGKLCNIYSYVYIHTPTDTETYIHTHSHMQIHIHRYADAHIHTIYSSSQAVLFTLSLILLQP